MFYNHNNNFSAFQIKYIEESLAAIFIQHWWRKIKSTKVNWKLDFQLSLDDTSDTESFDFPGLEEF